MNSYYYGKSGKGDFTKDDLPQNRFQLFWEMLRVRFSGLIKLNLIYVIPWLPTIIVLVLGVMSVLSPVTAAGTEEELAQIDILGLFQSVSITTLVLLFPCIAITGPFTAGACYVTRNWARDEHSFMWSDYKDAVKANWKQSLVVSSITGALPLIVYVCWTFYSQLASTNGFMIVPQMLVLMVAIIWCLSVTFMHPLIITYKLSMKDVLKNAFLLGVAKLPGNVAIRLLHCVPFIIAFVLAFFFVSPIYCILGLLAYYILIGFGLSRFVTASYTNGVFDKVINCKIEGVEVNRGLRKEEDDDDDDDPTDTNGEQQ